MRALAARVANVTGIPESPLDEWRLSLHYPPGAKAESYHIEGLHLDQNNNPERVASVLLQKTTAIESVLFACAALVSQRSSLPHMTEYIDELCVVAPLLQKLGGRLIGIQAVDGGRVAKEVEYVGGVWEEEEMQDGSNP